jgi:hypothetical protein
MVNHNVEIPGGVSDLWQGKDLQEGDFGCVATKGVMVEFRGRVARKGFLMVKSKN